MDAAEREALAEMLEPDLKPYHDRFARHRSLPQQGRGRDEVLAEMREMAELERDRWADGFASGAVYNGDPEHVAFLDDVYALNSQTNPLHADLWPSITKYEAEVVSMVAAMLHGGTAAAPDVCGTVTSGGTESILLAMKTYRDRARARAHGGTRQPNVVAPVSAHAAFDKASQYFGIELRKAPLHADFRVDVDAAAALVDDDTIALVGSAVQYPQGVQDPIGDLAALAAERGIGMHTDSCLGGFVLPWAERLGHHVPPFDFRLPGVTSMSCDTHKFGYAAKGTSVVLYRDPDLRAHQYYRTADWPGGLYFSPTFAGSRPGALSAQAWAALVTIGEEGYLDATRRIVDTAQEIRRGVAGIEGLALHGESLFVVALGSDDPSLDTYAVLDAMGRRRWSLNGLQSPPSMHLCVTLRHTQEGVADRFVADLASAVAEVRADPGTGGVMAPVYGMAASVESRGTVEEILRTYVDVLFRA
ncbi:MAG: aminotransferase class V-fold PLP-dependent enzyme [Actinobacteria bacterium]|nr:aminotransferase class V-fold PLP-dependent enzyme [Actinomycetota bacterium]